jgi:hypothetical protein
MTARTHMNALTSAPPAGSAATVARVTALITP